MYEVGNLDTDISINYNVKLKKPKYLNTVEYNLKALRVEAVPDNVYVHICGYSIYDNKYILYLLEKIDNTLYFPHFRSTKNTLGECTSIFSKLALHNVKYKGFILENNIYYLFFNLTNNLAYDKEKNNTNIFVSMYEIVFSRACYRYNIHKSVYTIFIKNPLLIYLYKNSLHLDIPECCYYLVNNNNHLAYYTYIGLEPNNYYNTPITSNYLDRLVEYLIYNNVSIKDLLTKYDI